VYVLIKFQLNPGILPFFPSQILSKDPLTDRFHAVDETLSDWNPLDYSQTWPHSPQSPVSQMCDEVHHGSVAQSWNQMPVVDRATLDKNGGLSEQVVHC